MVEMHKRYSLFKDNKQLHYSDGVCVCLCVCVCISICAQVSSSAQSRQSSLLRRGRQHKVQRPDPGGEQQPDGKTLRDLRLTGAVV